MKNIKHIICFLLAFCIMMSPIKIHAKEYDISSNISSNVKTFENILNELDVDEIASQESEESGINELNIELLGNGYNIYTITPENIDEISIRLKMNIKELVNTSIPNYEYYLAFYDMEENFEVQGISTYAGYSFETYPWSFKTIYIYSDSNSRMYQSDNVTIQINKSQWVDIANWGISTYFGAVFKEAWSFAELFGISDFLTIANANYGGNTLIEGSCIWTQKVRCIWSVYDEMWMSAYTTEYTKWTEKFTLKYYSRTTNSEEKITEIKSGTEYTDNYFNQSYIDSRAKTAFWYGSPAYEIISGRDVKFNGSTVISFKHNF